jgi:hypothetical protein
MPWMLWLCLPLLVYLLLASPRLAWLKAALLSLFLLMLSSWWLIDQLSGDGINAATLYHLRADMEGAGVGDFAVTSPCSPAWSCFRSCHWHCCGCAGSAAR